MVNNSKILDALGLSGQHITSLDIQMRPDKPAMVRVDMLADPVQCAKLSTVLREYVLVKKERAEAVDGD